jgi:predicted  nucleic acid-binding Zn-ribbon protein
MHDIALALISVIGGGLGVAFFNGYFNQSNKKLDIAEEIRQQLWKETKDLRENMLKMQKDLIEWEEKYYKNNREWEYKYSDLEEKYKDLEVKYNELLSQSHPVETTASTA